MKIPTKEQIQWLEGQYPVGTRIVLGAMDDPQAPPPGTKGTVRYVDGHGADWGGVGQRLLPVPHPRQGPFPQGSPQEKP